MTGFSANSPGWFSQGFLERRAHSVAHLGHPALQDIPLKNLIAGQAALEQVADCCVGDATDFSYIDGTKNAALQNYSMGSPCVSHLGVASCPNAVIWLIALVVILSFNAVAPTGSRSHVGQEVRKGFSPSLTDCNSTRSIVRISRIVLVGAPLNDATPNHKLGGDFPAGSCTMDSFDASQSVSSKAAAALGNAPLQARSKNAFGGSATALAKPNRLAIFVGLLESNDGESPECLAGQVLKIVGCLSNFGFSHDVALHESVTMWIEPEGRLRVPRLASL